MRLIALLVVTFALVGCAQNAGVGIPTTTPAPTNTLSPAQATERAVMLATQAASTPSPAAVEAGRIVFHGAAICSTCHTSDGSSLATGPTMLGISERARAASPDGDVIGYLRESIIHPDAIVDPAWRNDLMPDNYADLLTEQEISDLVSYLLSLK